MPVHQDGGSTRDIENPVCPHIALRGTIQRKLVIKYILFLNISYAIGIKVTGKVSTFRWYPWKFGGKDIEKNAVR
jgi:hypothetical protein